MKKLIVIGGGFAGAKIAKKLEGKFDLTLIDEKDFFEFTPGILRSIVKPSHLKRIESKHKDYLKNSEVIVDSVIKISKEKVVLKDKGEKEFDYLVIASGSKYRSPIKVKGILIADRGRKLKAYHNELRVSKKIVIIGGGLVGVELASEIADFYGDKKIFILQKGERIMERNNVKSSEFARGFLENKKVDIICGKEASEYKDGVVEIKGGERIKCGLVIVCAGISPNSAFMGKGNLDVGGFIMVNEYLQVREELDSCRENVFACGDVASISEEKTAQGAEKQADLVIRNVLALNNNKPLKKYKPKKRPMVISLGRYNGIFEWNNFVLTGIIPALMKKAIEIKTMMRYKLF
ncbi:MAG: FAD-dependent oxidoreductase [Nanoarchaeota archaeon]|nr:FAD-dependent oxidoreductase [Nanoarchaeota archaeon]